MRLTVNRRDPPDLERLREALFPALAMPPTVLYTGYQVSYEQGVVIIDNALVGTDVEAVSAIIMSAPPAARRFDGSQLDVIPAYVRAIALVMLELINTERAQHGRHLLSPVRFIDLCQEKLRQLAQQGG